MTKSPIGMANAEQLAREYPQLRADLDLCHEQLHELCQGKCDKAIMSVPPQDTDFDMQMSAAFDELECYRALGSVQDLVKVVRCKDCIHWQGVENCHGCDITDPDDYCSYGERMGK